MAILDLYSKRKKAAANAGKPDVYGYDNLPMPLRSQIAHHIWTDLFGPYERYEYNA